MKYKNNKKRKGVEHRYHAFVLPHELFSFLAGGQRHKELFNETTGAQGVVNFWNMMQCEEWYAAHPQKLKVEASPERYIPLRLHGDECKGFLVLP